jgi:hypothetical protein
MDDSVKLQKRAAYERKIRQLIGRAVQIPAQVVIWKPSGDIVAHGVLGRSDYPQREFLVTLENKENSMEFVLDSVDLRKQRHNLMVRMGSLGVVGFQETPQKIVRLEITYPMPKKFHLIQRRKDPRFRVPEGMEVDARFFHMRGQMERKQWKVIDISAGGFSFAAPGKISSQFNQGGKVEGGELQIRGRRIFFQGHMASVIELNKDTPQAIVRVGIMFTDIQEQDRNFIGDFVMKQAARTLT